MKFKTLLLLLLCVWSTFSFSHNLNYENVHLRSWTIAGEKKSVDATFYMYKDGNVFLQDAKGSVVHFPLSAFSKVDQEYAMKRYTAIKEVNRNLTPAPTSAPASVFDFRFWLVIVFLILFAVAIFTVVPKQKIRYFFPVLTAGIVSAFFSFTASRLQTAQSTTDPLTVDSAFAPFRPQVHTFWDSTYFYVESQGIPSHQMMVGITAWQQQVPIPQCYIGTNAWSIPLNPVLAATPVPVNQNHFLRGAVAVAVNGVAIFNPYTNTGADAYLTGQLDNWGGHCGRADDYHYHIAPVTLYNQTAANMPIAYALDGFAVYGSLEPDSTPMTTLDVNHGHFAPNGVYHYHASPAAPYMIGNMVGQVTEDSTLQIVPQAAAHPVRPSLTPLTGAVIADCQPNGTNNGYTLTYTLSGQNYYVTYDWTNNGLYTFNFISPSGTTTQAYNGFSQCTVPNAVNDLSLDESVLSIYPNPGNGDISLQLNSSLNKSDVREISVYSIQGTLIKRENAFVSNLDLKSISKGVYFVKVRFANQELTKKVLIQ